MLREERRVLGFDMSVNWRRSGGDLARRRFWLVERVWLWIGIWSWFWIRVLNWEIVMFGLSIETRSSPSLLRIRIIIFLIDCLMEIERESSELEKKKTINWVPCFALLWAGSGRGSAFLYLYVIVCLMGKPVKRTRKLFFPGQCINGVVVSFVYLWLRSWSPSETSPYLFIFQTSVFFQIFI